MHKSKTQKILQRNKKKNTSRNMIIKWLSTSDNKSLKSILTEKKKVCCKRRKLGQKIFPWKYCKQEYNEAIFLKY